MRDCNHRLVVVEPILAILSQRSSVAVARALTWPDGWSSPAVLVPQLAEYLVSRRNGGSKLRNAVVAK